MTAPADQAHGHGHRGHDHVRRGLQHRSRGRGSQGLVPLRLLSSFLKVALLGFPDEGRYRGFFGERHDLSWAQLVSIPPAVPHAYCDATFCRVELLCIDACRMEPPWAFRTTSINKFSSTLNVLNLDS